MSIDIYMPLDIKGYLSEIRAIWKKYLEITEPGNATKNGKLGILFGASGNVLSLDCGVLNVAAPRIYRRQCLCRYNLHSKTMQQEYGERSLVLGKGVRFIL